MKKTRLAILASGNGSNADSIIKWSKNSEMAEVVCVLSNKRDAYVLDRAFSHNIEAFSVLKRKNEDPVSYDKRLIEKLQEYSPDFIILAGFMRLLSSDFLKHFNYKIINIHPSLLPLFPGKDGYGDTFRAGHSEAGCTVHYVDEGMDTGEIIAQKKIPIIIDENFEDFKKRALIIENKFYPEVLEKLLLSKGLL